MTLPKAPQLVVITSPSGARFSVAKAHQERFQGLVNDLEAGGYVLNPKTSGGYNPRYIAGTTTPSRHAHAEAIDVNWDENTRGKRGKIPVELARAVAAKHGLTWGGEWKNPDDMHFEVPGYAPAGAGFKSGLKRQPGGTGNFGLADANVAELSEPLTQDYSGGGDPPAAPSDDNRALLAALALRNSPFGGGFGGPSSLSNVLTQGMQPAAPELTPIVQPQPGIVGGPLPISQRLR